MSFLELNKVTKIYPNGTKAVHETSMNVENGEFMVFVGPSGCGKSTLLRMIAGLEDITEGYINLDGILIIYIEGDCKKNLKELTVFNDLLVNWFPDQQNIVNLSGELKSSFTFNKNIKTHVFQ